MPKPIPTRRYYIPHGDEGIVATVEKMKDLILDARGNPIVRQKAEELVGNSVEPNDAVGEAQQIYRYVRDNVRFTRDPRGLEYIQTPEHLIRTIEERGYATGDCDDKTILGLALLKNLGHKVGIKVTSYVPDGRFSHVYGLVKLDGKWVPFDATRPDRWLGWEAGGITREKTWILDHANQEVGEVRWSRIAETAIAGVTTAVVLWLLNMRK